jgi:peroxisomal 2,4-dienoyl-CoA reductase
MPREEFLSNTWRDGIFDNKVLFCTGGAGTICSAQTRAFVALGGNACIIGRNVEKTERMAKDIATARPGAKVIGIGQVDVRDPQALQDAADRCAKELGGIDFAIAGAAGNFLAPMAQLSSNAFKSVMDIDALGSYNTAKATLPLLRVPESTRTPARPVLPAPVAVSSSSRPLSTTLASLCRHTSQRRKRQLIRSVSRPRSSTALSV